MTQKKKKAGQTGIEQNQDFRTLRFEIRLSPGEYNGLVSQALLAEGNSLAQYARNKLIYGGHAATEHYRQQRDTSKAAIAELARIGNNVNQIARALNCDDDVSTAMLEELCKVEIRLAAMDQQFQNNLRAQVQS